MVFPGVRGAFHVAEQSAKVMGASRCDRVPVFKLEGGRCDKLRVFLLKLAKPESCSAADLMRRLNVPEQVLFTALCCKMC